MSAGGIFIKKIKQPLIKGLFKKLTTSAYK